MVANLDIKHIPDTTTVLPLTAENGLDVVPAALSAPDHDVRALPHSVRLGRRLPCLRDGNALDGGDQLVIGAT